MKAHGFALLTVLAALALVACATPPTAAPDTTPPPDSSPAPTAPPDTTAVVVPTAVMAPSTAPPTTASELRPLGPEDCAAVAELMSRTLGIEVTQGETPIHDAASGQTGTGCQATATGTGEDFESPTVVVDEVSQALEAEGWATDPYLLADGPTGMSTGMRSGSNLCLVAAMWDPDPAANCPKDQPIGACDLEPDQQLYTVTIDCARAPTGIANPASENCIAQGGTLAIEARGDGGQFGACTFVDNQQCEEWALMRGDCPAGGIEVTGYVTPAGRYCAITGGAYAVTGQDGASEEQGTCTFGNGTVCDAWDYYNGRCDADAG